MGRVEVTVYLPPVLAEALDECIEDGAGPHWSKSGTVAMLLAEGLPEGYQPDEDVLDEQMNHPSPTREAIRELLRANGPMAKQDIVDAVPQGYNAVGTALSDMEDAEPVDRGVWALV